MGLASGMLGFISFYFRASTLHQVHSPFLYALFERAFDEERNYYAFETIEALRSRLLTDPTMISRKDYGAGSKHLPRRQGTVRAVAKSILSTPAQCRMLFRITATLAPASVLELGTAFGISSAYLGAACAGTGEVTTLEGDKVLAGYARRVHHETGLTNVKIIEGRFDDTLPAILENPGSLDLCFLDGHHEEAATLRYFHLILPALHPGSVVIIDDIHWSKGMQRAWMAIRRHPAVMATVDLFSMGLVFFRTEFHDKFHLDLVPSRLVPWKFL